jgi:hypothetical protein
MKKPKLSKETKQVIKLLSNYRQVLWDEVDAEEKEGHEDAMRGARRCKAEIGRVSNQIKRLEGGK